jgi:predicted MPP superfamily phosphohydrolase
LSSFTRRRFLQGSAVAAGAAALAVAEDGCILEPNYPKLTRIEVPLLRLPEAFDGFAIVQLSDFHYDAYFTVVPIRAAVEMVNRLNPDLIVLTGDFVTTSVLKDYLHNAKEAANQAEPCAAILGQLRAGLGTVAIVGNHDAASDPARISGVLQSHGITMLRNRAVPVERGVARIWLAGLDSIMEGKPDIESTLRGIPKSEAIVVLVHEPDFADVVTKYPVDLQLSGHSHGGQIWIPGIGAPWLPDFAQRYPRGMYRIGGLTLYTNIGLGTIRVPVRLNCPPEVTLFTLRTPRAGTRRDAPGDDGRMARPRVTLVGVMPRSLR